MHTVWIDFGALHIERETDARLLALHYLLGNRPQVQVAGVSTQDDSTKEVLEKILRQTGQEAPSTLEDAAAILSVRSEPVSLLALGGTDIFQQSGRFACLTGIILVGCEALIAADVLDLSQPDTALFLEPQTVRITIGQTLQQASCCCGSAALEAPDFADLGLTAAMYLLHPEWFSLMHYENSPASYPFLQHMSEAIEEDICKSLPQMRMQEENCPCQGTYLDKLVKPAVLVVLSDGPSHGFQIIQELERRQLLGGESLDATGLYRMLKRMESAGYLTSRWDTERSHAKRVFQITPLGRSCLANWVATLENYRDYVERMVQQIRAVL